MQQMLLFRNMSLYRPVKVPSPTPEARTTLSQLSSESKTAESPMSSSTTLERSSSNPCINSGSDDPGLPNSSCTRSELGRVLVYPVEPSDVFGPESGPGKTAYYIIPLLLLLKYCARSILGIWTFGGRSSCESESRTKRSEDVTTFILKDS